METGNFKFLAALSLSLMMVSCSLDKELGSASTAEHFFSVCGELPGLDQESQGDEDADTKGYLGSFVSASWTKGDQVSVVNLTTGKILGGTLSADKDGIIATFTGTVTGEINEGDAMALFYPALDISGSDDFADRKFSLSAQSKDAKVPLVTYATFTAESSEGSLTGLDLTFKYVLSYLKINMANLPADAAISRITLRNIPSEMTISVNEDGNGFDVATSEEKSAKGKIVLDGSYVTKSTGALSVSVGVMPSDASDLRSIVVTADDCGEFISPLTSAALSSHKYYNTVASQFDKLSEPGVQNYGVYNVCTGKMLDEYEDFVSTIITGVEDGEFDFTLLDTSFGSYWTVKGLPADAGDGDSFTARLLTYGINGLSGDVFSGAAVKMSEPDGDCTKLWVRAGEYLFIVRK